MIDAASARELAQRLDEALCDRREIEPLTRSAPLSLDDAYAVQRVGLGLRLLRGERAVGFKMGLTSAAKRQQMDLHQPIYGVLTDAMRVEGELRAAEGIHPKVEPEIAFITAAELRGRATREEALGACGAVCTALEVLDSRFAGFKYFSLPDVVADNCSSWKFALGERCAPVDVGDLVMRIFFDGKLAREALSSAISGHPLDSLIQLAAMLDAHGEALPAGSIVLAGAATAAEPLRPGMEVRLEVPGLASVALRVT